MTDCTACGGKGFIRIDSPSCSREIAPGVLVVAYVPCMTCAGPWRPEYHPWPPLGANTGPQGSWRTTPCFMGIFTRSGEIDHADRL
jgi:hypothetical protein